MTWLSINPTVLLFLVNVVIGACVACALGLLAARTLRRRTVLLRHSFLVVAIGLTMFCPLVFLMSSSFEFGLFSISKDSATTAPNQLSSPIVSDDSMRTEMNLWRKPNSHQVAAPTLIEQSGNPLTKESSPDSVAETSGITAARISHSPPRSITRHERNVWLTCLTVVAAMWVLGLIICFGRLVIGLIRVRRLRRTCEKITNPRVLLAAQSAFESVGLAQHDVFESLQAASPLTVGLMKVAIVMPSGCSDSLDDDELNCVLLHEAAHIKRRDTWIGLLQSIARSVFWWNPLLHITNRLVNRFREQICDDYVIASYGDGRPLAKAIVKVATWCTVPRAALPCTATLTNEAEVLSERINRLTEKKESAVTIRLDWKATRSLTLFSLILALVVFIPALKFASAHGHEKNNAGQITRDAPPDEEADAPRQQDNRVREEAENKQQRVPNLANPVRAVEKMILSHFDVDRDGTLNVDEIRKMPWPRSEASFLYCDLNHDRRVTVTELSDVLDLVYRSQAKHRQQTPDRFAVANWKKLDVNNDGVIDRDERKRKPHDHIEGWFKADLNRDGKLTLSEMNLAFNYIALDKSIRIKAALDRKHAAAKKTNQSSMASSSLYSKMVLDRFDRDGNKSISRDEARNAPWTNSETVWFDADKNNDNQVTDRELQSQYWSLQQKLKKHGQKQIHDHSTWLMKVVDRNHDGVIDRDETSLTSWPRAGNNWFKGDANADQQVTYNELVLAMAMNALSKSARLAETPKKQNSGRVVPNRSPRVESSKGRSPAIDQIEKLGGRISFDERNSDLPVRLWISGDNINDDALKHLRTLTSLKEIALIPKTQVTDAGLKYLQGLTNLEILGLKHSQVTNAGLGHLKGLARLKELHLVRTKVTDDGLRHLGGVTSLETLNLSGIEMTDVGLEHLRGLTNLKTLSLSGTQVSDAGLKHLMRMTHLENLYLGGTDVSDSGLANLKEMDSLHKLYIEQTGVTDDGLKHLAGLTNLTFVNVLRTRVTDVGIDELKSNLPKCYVVN